MYVQMRMRILHVHVRVTEGGRVVSLEAVWNEGLLAEALPVHRTEIHEEVEVPRVEREPLARAQAQELAIGGEDEAAEGVADEGSLQALGEGLARLGRHGERDDAVEHHGEVPRTAVDDGPE